jgi:hypothetical protein
MIPPAAIAVLAAAIEDATRRGEAPARAAQRAAQALNVQGWTITPRTPQNGAQRPA